MVGPGCSKKLELRKVSTLCQWTCMWVRECIQNSGKFSSLLSFYILPSLLLCAGLQSPSQLRMCGVLRPFQVSPAFVHSFSVSQGYSGSYQVILWFSYFQDFPVKFLVSPPVCSLFQPRRTSGQSWRFPPLSSYFKMNLLLFLTTPLHLRFSPSAPNHVSP